MGYNTSRSYEERELRLQDLRKRAVPLLNARYHVVPGRDAYEGFYNTDRSYILGFDHAATARSFARHYSDLHDSPVGVFKAPVFVGGFDER
jgi:hypothetical protein